MALDKFQTLIPKLQIGWVMSQTIQHFFHPDKMTTKFVKIKK